MTVTYFENTGTGHPFEKRRDRYGLLARLRDARVFSRQGRAPGGIPLELEGMPRIARVVVPGVPHHVTQRGNNRQDVFFSAGQRRYYLQVLKTLSKRCGLDIHGYCLMTNHVHLIVVPQRADSMARALARTHWVYARHINETYGRSGHLWQARFFSCPLDEAHYWAALCYAETNPNRAGLVRCAWEYRWSSAIAHVTGHDSIGLLELSAWTRRLDREQWAARLSAEDTGATDGLLRRHTRTGHPLGTQAFLKNLEAQLGRRLRARPVGRPCLPT